MKIGDLVRFNHEQNGGPVHRVVSVMADGMVEINDMGGYFAPHLFVVADDIADIPPSSSRRVTAGPYTLELPTNGVAIVYEADGAGVDHKLPGGIGYLEALVQFAGEVIRLRAMLDAMRLSGEEVQPMMGIPPGGWKP